MMITHMEEIHLARKSAPPALLRRLVWTVSHGESPCTAANSKQSLFYQSSLNSGSKTIFFSQLNLWLKSFLRSFQVSLLSCARSCSFSLAMSPPHFGPALPFHCALLSLPFFHLYRAIHFHSRALIMHANAEWMRDMNNMLYVCMYIWSSPGLLASRGKLRRAPDIAIVQWPLGDWRHNWWSRREERRGKCAEECFLPRPAFLSSSARVKSIRAAVMVFFFSPFAHHPFIM